MNEWTVEQKKFLRDSVGISGWSVLQKKCGGRSKQAVLHMVRRQFGGGGVTRGSYQLLEAMRETGYSRSQFLRAGRALNQRWMRTKRRGDYLITGEQLEDMVSWLRHDYWSKPLEIYCCLQCGTVDRPHYTFGLCRRCHGRLGRFARRSGLPWAAKTLLEHVESLPANFQTRRVAVNLRAGRAPTLNDLEYLCALTRP